MVRTRAESVIRRRIREGLEFASALPKKAPQSKREMLAEQLKSLQERQRAVHRQAESSHREAEAIRGNLLDLQDGDFEAAAIRIGQLDAVNEWARWAYNALDLEIQRTRQDLQATPSPEAANYTQLRLRAAEIAAILRDLSERRNLSAEQEVSRYNLSAELYRIRQMLSERYHFTEMLRADMEARPKRGG